MGANTLTNLIPAAFKALDNVAREQVGLIPAVSRNSGAERVAIGQNLLIPIAPPATAADNTPGVTAPDTGDQSIGNVNITISKSKHVAIRWNGEQTLAMNNAGIFDPLLIDQFQQAFRTLCNLMETDLASTYVSASRAYGTAGTAPFGTAQDLSDVAGPLQILDDNGAPATDRRLVIGSAAMANIRGKQAGLFKVNEAGTDQLLRQGSIGRLESFDVGVSSQIAAVTKGGGTAYQSNFGAGYTVGANGIALDTGTGTVLAGDVVTFTGDANKYVNGVALAGGNISLNAPGLRAALPDNTVMTVGNSYRANLAFHKSAIQFASRLPAVPKNGDLAIDTTTVSDPITGLTFEIAQYAGFLQNTYHVRIAWGWAVVKPEFMAILLG